MGRLATCAIALAAALAVVSPNLAATRRYTMASAGSTVNHVAVIGDSYTTGTDEGGRESKAWPARTWLTLARQGTEIAPNIASEGRAGYAVRGDHGSVFSDLAARAVHRNDALVVFFGSRNDQDVDPELLTQMLDETFDLVLRSAPSASLLVIGPPWPTADPPEAVLRIRDLVKDEALAACATFVDPIAQRWFVARPDLIGADGVHPNDAGHAYMADKIAPLIRSQLPKRS